MTFVVFDMRQRDIDSRPFNIIFHVSFIYFGFVVCICRGECTPS
jgi:hypothetical protein